MSELGVEVRTGMEATPTSVLAEQPDAVIVATGSRYHAGGDSAFAHGPIPGSDRDLVFTPEQILEGGARPHGRVLILDEQRDHAGPAIAELLASAGSSVELVSSGSTVLGEWTYRAQMHFQLIPILRQLGIRMTAEHYIREIGERKVTLFHVLTNEEEVRDVDAVVLLTSRVSQGRSLERELKGKVPRVYSVGDAAAPRSFLDATYDGQRFARLIGEPGAPRTTGEAIFSDVPDEAIQRSAATLLQPAAAVETLMKV
jgi:2,4-dienoyl-CoA reductase (NADPH2)